MTGEKTFSTEGRKKKAMGKKNFFFFCKNPLEVKKVVLCHGPGVFLLIIAVKAPYYTTTKKISASKSILSNAARHDSTVHLILYNNRGERMPLELDMCCVHKKLWRSCDNLNYQGGRMEREGGMNNVLGF